MSLNFDVTSPPKLLNPQKKMIPLERASQDLGRSTILIMKIQKGGPQIKIIWGEIIPPIFPEEDGQMVRLPCAECGAPMKIFHFYCAPMKIFHFYFIKLIFRTFYLTNFKNRWL